MIDVEVRSENAAPGSSCTPWALENLPPFPPMASRLLEVLSKDDININEVGSYIAAEPVYAMRVLQMANSPLFGRWQAITSIRGAVIALGMQKMRDIALSCSMMRIFPMNNGSKGPVVCWEHSLACALLSRRIARRLGYDLENAYLAGLLHDLGMVFHACTFPHEFEAVQRACTDSGMSISEAEMKVLGFTHTDTGRMLGEGWNLAPLIVDTIRAHHSLSSMVLEPELVAIIHLSDRFCRARGIGYGIPEQVWFDNPREPSIDDLKAYCPLLATLNTARLEAEMETYIRDVRTLVTTIYRMQ